MKQKDLILGLGLISAFSMSAQSAYTGSVAPAEGSASFYLYQVESNQWMQANNKTPGWWTTHANLGSNGFDVEVIKADAGYQLNPKFRNNLSINSGDDRFYMDTGRPVSYWALEPVIVDGVSNAYNIVALVGEGVAEEYLIGESGGALSDVPTATTWQLVTREERIEKMKSAVANGPVDASWLIPWQDLGRNDSREGNWIKQFNSDGSAIGLGGRDYNSVHECWHRVTNYAHYVTLTDIPNGTYRFTVQAWYRDTEVENVDCQQRMADGTEVLRAEYFAGEATGTVMSIADQAPQSEVADNYTYFVEPAGIWVPNNLDQASNVFASGAYTNEWIEAVVTDGTLTVGICKRDADHRDWLVYDNFQLQYVSAETPAVDLSGLKDRLSALINEAESTQVTPAISKAIDEGKNALNSENATEIRLAIFKLQSVVAAVNLSANEIWNFNETKKLTDAEGVDAAKAVELFNNAASRDDYANALKELRYARRRNAADKQEDIFPGQPVAEGKFYLYNVGQKQFLCGGSDWGAHAALGFPGVEITLEAGEGCADGSAGSFYIETNLWNGENHYLNYRGYMDAPRIDDFGFIPVEGKENVYNIIQADYMDVHMAWNPYASVDAGNADETTVGTECRDLQADDLNAQWKLVTKAEREALLAEASLEKPADATIYILSPNFNQRENANVVWSLTDAAVWDYGANHYDFAVESWNTESCDINQMVVGLPGGVYVASVQGFYRNGNHAAQANADFAQNAYFYAGDPIYDVYLPNITEESMQAPGEGNNAVTEDGSVTYQYPDGIVQATNFFKSGLYKVYTVIEVAAGNDLPLGVAKDVKGEEEDWVVADNFRLTYYGANTTVEEVKNHLNGVTGIESIVDGSDAVKGDNRIFNIQGIEVKNATMPGIYIQNGKKFIVK